MVKREGQKFGLRTGATLRSQFSPRNQAGCRWAWGFYYSSHSQTPPKYICTKKMRLKRLRQPQDNKEGVLMKHVTNIYRYKKDEIEKMLRRGSPFDKMDNLDGLNSPTRNFLHYEMDYAWEEDSGVQYSLGKHKRWLLPKLIEESLRDEVFVEDDPKVVTIKRRIHAVHGKLDSKDCFEVVDGKTGKVHKPKNRAYDQVHSFYKKSKHAELRYEFGLPYKQSRWPHNQQTKSKPKVFSEYDHQYGDYHYKAAQNKHYKRAWLVKCGEKKRNGKTAGQKRRELLASHDEVPRHSYQPCEQNGNNIKVIDREEFDFARSAQLHQETPTPFELSGFFKKSDRSNTECVVEKPAACAVENCSKNRATSQLFKTYGKGCAIVVPNPSEPESTEKVNEKHMAGSTTFVPIQPVIYTSESKQKAKVLIWQDSIIPHTLKENWNGLYQEGNSFPRKFVIDITSMVCKLQNLQNTFMYILFEPQCEAVTQNTYVKTLTSLVLDSEVETNHSEMSNIAKVFVSKLESTTSNYGPVDVVNMAVSTVEELQSLLDGNAVPSPSPLPPPVVPRKAAVLPLVMLKDMFRWQFASYAVSDALVEMKRKLSQKQHAGCDLPHKDKMGVECDSTNYCGVCFEELSGGEDGECVEFTALKKCGHVFCNSCWEIHLKTQISDGNTSPCCPEYKCSVTVDDITIMALVPSLYSKLMDRRVNTLLETDPLWQWCPGNQCGKLVKAEGSSAVPVDCSCGAAWCFKCQQEAHWPATCDQARKFHDLTKDYNEDLIGRKDYISSVPIKRCPFCRYPIEKSFGCPHMQCMMCEKDFCWECLKPFDDSDHYECDGKEDMEDVVLAIEMGSERYDKYLKIALTNRLARRRNALRKLNKELLELENSTTAFKFLDSFFKSGQSRKPHSTVHKLLDMYVTKGVVEQLKSVTDFKLQAQFVLEGAAKFVGLSMNAKYHRRLHGDISNLQYVVEQMEELVKDHTQLGRDNVRHKLDKLMCHGKKYILSIGTFVEKRCQ